MKTKQKYSHIIWDWNGTLLNDVQWCIEVINTMLAKRGIQTLQNVSDYHNAFCFPIIQYYINAGFDFSTENFEDVAKEYITLYHSSKNSNYNLYSNAKPVLSAINRRGITQIILSASELNNLLSQVAEFNIAGYFDEMLGLSNIYAKSKINIGLDYISRKEVSNAILIGDTTHDYEVAKSLGTDCILIPSGHQSREALQSCNVPLLNDISHVLDYI
ncbi:MAG: HAD hydrolase-like protein [Defluviitaleaceae bacterium]|nr:HAD hydrolase-like protein [Defluviitaleaceae bacterium]